MRADVAWEAQRGLVQVSGWLQACRCVAEQVQGEQVGGEPVRVCVCDVFVMLTEESCSMLYNIMYNIMKAHNTAHPIHYPNAHQTHAYTHMLPHTCNSSQLQRALLVRCVKHVAVGGDLLYEQARHPLSGWVLWAAQVPW